MRRLLSSLLVALLLAASLPALASRNLVVGSGAERHALVIGNDNYTRVRPLDNARADARAMAGALQQAGFKVSLHLDLSRAQLLAAVRNFKMQLSGGSEAVFFFAGHGVQLGAANYLLPVDINADNEEQVKDDGLPLQRVLDDITEQKARFSLAIVDACRDNPFPRVAGRSIGTGRGLAPTTAATGQMVIYSAGAGQIALDRLNPADRDPNGLFTRVFLKEMLRPGVSVDRVLREVRDQVVALAKAQGHEQVPALYDQAIGEFYFRPPAPGSQRPSAGAPVDPSVNDRALWNTVKESRSAVELNAYLEQFPDGLFAAVARARLKALQGTGGAAPPAAAARPQASSSAVASAAPSAAVAGGNPRAVFNTNRGAIEVELLADKAPRSVANFLQYARSGFYDGTIFHRVIGDFMIQGGGFTPDLQQKPTRAPIENEATNGLPNELGTLAMARTSDPHSATAQFFINLKDNDFLNHKAPSGQGWGYTVFGRVVRGMDVVRSIGGVATGKVGAYQNVPREAVVIEAVRVQ